MTLQWLLQLPPTLRTLALSHRTLRPWDRKIPIQTIIKSRFLQTTKSHLSKQSKPPKPSPKKPPPPSSPPPKQPPNPTLSPAPKSPTNIKLSTDLHRLLQTHGQLLIYHAPSHTSLYTLSYILGTTFIFSALLQSRDLDSNTSRKLPWYIRTFSLVTGIFFAAAGTAFLYAPSKLIRSIRIISDVPGKQALLRFQVKPTVPFMQRLRPQNFTFDVPTGEVFIDKRIFADEIPPYVNIPIARAQEFTEADLDARATRGRWGESNRSVVDIWPRIRRDVARMFLRDGMAYVRIEERGNWKLDLHGAMILDEARPLVGAMTPVELDRGVLSRVWRLMQS